MGFYFADRLVDLMNSRHISGADISRFLKVSKAAVTKWTKGESIPSSKYIHDLAKLLDTSAEYLLSGKESIQISQSLESKDSSHSRVRYGPIINLVEAGESLQMHVAKSGNNKELSLPSDLEEIPLPKGIEQGSGFWVKEVGNANQPKIPASSLVAINLKPKSYDHGDLVLAIINGNAVLRVLYKDTSGDYLRPINKEAPFTSTVDFIEPGICEVYGRAEAVMNNSLNFAD